MGTPCRHVGACHRCGKGGHLARDCSLHTCFRCNGRGHMAWECPHGVSCSKCGEKGHLQRNCKNVSCHKCGRQGHIAKFCNDPFVKAAEVEKHERQQALLIARTPASVSLAIEGLGSAVGNPVSATLRRKDSPSPWDGLGEPIRHQQLREAKTRHGGADQSSRQANEIAHTASSPSRKKRTSSGVFQAPHLRVVSVKRKETDVKGSSKFTGITECDWKGLVGYESESDEDADNTHAMENQRVMSD